MKPITNSQIEARKSTLQIAADHGMRTEKSLSSTLRRSYVLVRGTGPDSNRAEIRDSAQNNIVVASGTYAKMVVESTRRGLNW